MERVVLANDGRIDQRIQLRLRVDADHAPVQTVKGGDPSASAVTVTVPADGATWASGRAETRLQCSPVADEVAETEQGALDLTWRIDIAARTSQQVELVVTAVDLVDPVLVAAPLRLDLAVTSRRSSWTAWRVVARRTWRGSRSRDATTRATSSPPPGARGITRSSAGNRSGPPG